MYYRVLNGGTLETVTFSAQSFTLFDQTSIGTTTKTFNFTLSNGKKAKYVGLKQVTASANQSGHSNGASIVSFSQNNTTLTVTVSVTHGGNHNFPQTINYTLIIEAIC